MADDVSLDGRLLKVVENEQGDVSGETLFHFQQDGTRISAQYSGGPIVEEHLLGTLAGGYWDSRYVQIDTEGETATGHSVGEVELLADGRVRVTDEWKWESESESGSGTGDSVHEEVKE